MTRLLFTHRKPQFLKVYHASLVYKTSIKNKFVVELVVFLIIKVYPLNIVEE